MRLLIVFLGLLITCSVNFSQAPQNASLYVSKCRADEPLCETQEIVRYHFVDGDLKTSETIFTSQTQDIRFDLGASRIIDKHLLISSWGDVIDLNTRKVLYKSNGKLVRIRGSRMWIDVDKVNDDDLYVFDLKTLRTKRIKSSEDIEDLDGDDFSPNGRIVAKWSDSDPQFQFFQVSEEIALRRIRVVEGSFSAECSSRCSSWMRVPYVWIDNSRILTQRSNGDLITIDIYGKIKNVVKINIKETPDAQPNFLKDKFGNIFYHCDTTYLIDVEKNTFSIEQPPIGNGFTRKYGEGFWSEYFSDGKTIGKIWSGQGLASDNYLAVLYAKEGKNLGYPDGIKVWSKSKRNWVTIEEPSGVSLIDWID